MADGVATVRRRIMAAFWRNAAMKTVGVMVKSLNALLAAWLYRNAVISAMVAYQKRQLWRKKMAHLAKKMKISVIMKRNIISAKA